jgi:tRNA threonylcarbamoyladenosine biosynthesis protein TsaB
VYLAHYNFDSKSRCFDTDYSLVLPENLRVPADSVLAGNAHGVYGARIAWSGPSYTLLPTAAAILRLCPALLAAGRAVDAEHALPLYIRDKVAKTTVERDAEKQGALLAAAQARPTD